MIRKALTIFLLMSPLLACSTLEFPGVYRVQVEQGNIVTEEMVSQLEPGMSTSQVEFILGSPLIKDSFTPNRWDYYYMLRKPDDSIEKQRLTVFFDQGVLSHYESTITTPAHDGTPAAPPAEAEELIEVQEAQEAQQVQDGI